MVKSPTKLPSQSGLRHKNPKTMAEGVGFEPTKVSLAGFQDRCTRPLCEPSVENLTGWSAFEAIRAALR